MHCDLLFADAAVLIEGPAERVLVPHFVAIHPEFSMLSESYITWLEIGGSHAHKLRLLIERIGLTTLIITDIDSCDGSGNAVDPARGQGYKTRNQTLSSWCPASADLDDLLNMAENNKVKHYAQERFSVRAAYQCPKEMELAGANVEALAYTLEDAIVYENIELFRTLQGTGLIAKFRAAIAASSDQASLASELRNCLKTGSKAEFALDLLELPETVLLSPPSYIRDGLLWLGSQLRKKQEELGLAPVSDSAASIASKTATGAAA